MKSPALVSHSSRPSSPRHRRELTAHHRRGLSLIELLAATLISLMVMAATVALFGVVGDKIAAGRAMIETSDSIRATENRLRLDLRGETVDMRPWARPESGMGYFEILKGPSRDSQPDPTNSPSNNVLVGYTQDALFFTTRSKDLPFIGRYGSTTIESQMAEVVWFLQPTMKYDATGTGTPVTPTTYTLYRRQFLILPPPATASQPLQNPPFYDNYDISAHPDGQTPPHMIPNSLADLAYRENRFAHNSSAFPYPVLAAPTSKSSGSPNAPPVFFLGGLPSAQLGGIIPFQPFQSTGANASPRYGEDVMLTNVLSFDVKVWDPAAQVLVSSDGTTSLVPSDPGYVNGKPIQIPNTNPVQNVSGAYVDLNYSYNTTIPKGNSYFSGPAFGSGWSNAPLIAPLVATNNGNLATYDTWSMAYEFQNVTGVDGLDQGGGGGVDSPLERSTSPPYPVPLRGVQIKIRVYEPTSRQVREVTVDETFIPD